MLLCPSILPEQIIHLDETSSTGRSEALVEKPLTLTASQLLGTVEGLQHFYRDTEGEPGEVCTASNFYMDH